MHRNNMGILDLVFYGYHGKVDGRKGMDSLCLRNNVGTGVKDGTATSGKVTSQVSANEPAEDDDDEIYDPFHDLEVKYTTKTIDLNNFKSTNQNARNVALNQDNEVEERTGGSQQFNVIVKESSELKFEDAGSGDDEIPEVKEETPLPELEEPVSEGHISDPEEEIRSDDGSVRSTIDSSDKERKMSPKSSKVRRKSASCAAKNSNTNYMTCEKLQKIKDTVEKAIRERKTFTVQGSFPTIREAMKQRGWVEREMHRYKLNSMEDCCHSSSQYYPSVTDLRNTESMLTARLLRNVKVDFLWTMRSEPIDWQDVPKKQIINRFPRAYFTTKVGLCAYLQNMHWFCESGVSHVLFPRCYNVCHPEEMTAFTDDFRLTACLGLLKWLVEKYENKGEASVKSVEGKIPFTAVEFAIQRCQEYIAMQNHEDIDKFDTYSIWDHQWDQFLTSYYLAVHENFLLMECRRPAVQELYESAKKILHDIRDFWPQIDLDGMNNIWIVKPGAKSRGRGIQLTNKLEKVMDKINPAAIKESRYVVQKYIERPLLIYNTKFDIRQWFLVTCAQPLTIWMYKESYLRFCSQPFDLNNLHESVHLCNNAVQCKYKNAKRDSSLPDENMWDCYTFQTYLRGIGQADMWEKSIYPGMRESIICALLASQEHMDRRRNCFELYGADFMLDEGFSPWLIEINSCPCMQPTTSITARMCSQCLEDVIKVVVDKRFDRKASTGMFELIYRQQIPRAPPYLGMSLSIRGTKISNSTFFRSLMRTRNRTKKRQDSSDERQSNCSSPEELNCKKKKSAKKKACRVSDFQHEASSESEDNSTDMIKSFCVQTKALPDNVILNETEQLKGIKSSQNYLKPGLDDMLFFETESEQAVEEAVKNISESSSNDVFLDTEPEIILRKKPSLHVVKPPYNTYNKKVVGDGDSSIELESFDSGKINLKNNDLDISDSRPEKQNENCNRISDIPEIIVESSINSELHQMINNDIQLTVENNTSITDKLSCEIKYIINEFRQKDKDVETCTNHIPTWEKLKGEEIFEPSSEHDSEIQDLPKSMDSLEKKKPKSASLPLSTISVKDEKIVDNRSSSQEKIVFSVTNNNRDKSRERNMPLKNKSGEENSEEKLVIDTRGKRDNSCEKAQIGSPFLSSAILKISKQSLTLQQDKKSRESSYDRESASSGPEINIPKKKKIIKMKTPKFRPMESESLSSDPEQKSIIKNIKIKKPRKTFKEQELMQNRIQYNSGKNIWNESPEQETKSISNDLISMNKVIHMVKKTEVQLSVNSNPECTFEMSKKRAMKIIRDSSEERNLSNTSNGNKKTCKRNIKKKKSLAGYGKMKHGSNESKLYSRRRKSRESTEEHEPVSSSSENTILSEKCSIQTKVIPNSEGKDLARTMQEFPHSPLNNFEAGITKIQTNDEFIRVKNYIQEMSDFKEQKHSKNVNPDENIKSTAEYIGPIIADLIEDLAHQKKSQNEESKCDETLVEKDKISVNNRCSTELHDKLSQTEKKDNPANKHNSTVAQREKTVTDKQGAGNSKQVSMFVRGEADSKGKTGVKMWSYPKDGLNWSKPTVEVVPKHTKPCKRWKNSDDAEKSMIFFNEWRQKLDHTRASCEDMLAKLKFVRDNECVINKPKYFSIDKGINWEGEIDNKPTISDIIKKLSQTQPEREFFMCKRYVDTLPVYTLSEEKDKMKRNPCNLTMIMEDSINFMAKQSERLFTESYDQKLNTTSHGYCQTPGRNVPSRVIRGILPHIKQRIKQQPNLHYNGQRIDNIFAVGMSFKTLQNNENQKQLLLPLGSEHCQGMKTIPPPVERASCN